MTTTNSQPPPDRVVATGKPAWSVEGVRLHYPHHPRGELVAMGSLRIVDPNGFGFSLSDIRLLRRAGGRWAVAMPSEPKRKPCPACHGRNPLAARFCCQCGGPVEQEKSVYIDLVAPINTPSRDYVLEAVLREHFRVQAEIESGGGDHDAAGSHDGNGRA